MERFRIRPRCSSLMVLMAASLTYTSPEVGVSRPPSRCNSVLLPEPEAPTTATSSPAVTARLTPLSTSTRYSPSTKCFTSCSQRSTSRPVPGRGAATRSCRGSLIAQRLRGLGAGGTPGRIEGGKDGQQEARDGDLEHVAGIDGRGQVTDVVDAGRQELGVEGALQE